MFVLTKWILISGLIYALLAQSTNIPGIVTNKTSESKQFIGLFQVYEKNHKPYERLILDTAFKLFQKWQLSVSQGVNLNQTFESTVIKYFQEQAIIIGYRDLIITSTALIQRLQDLVVKIQQERQSTYMTRYYELESKLPYDDFQGKLNLMNKLKIEDEAEYLRWRSAVTKLSSIIKNSISDFQENLKKSVKDFEDRKGKNISQFIFQKVDGQKYQQKVVNSSQRKALSERINKIKNQEKNIIEKSYYLNLEQFRQIFQIMYQRSISIEQYAKTEDWKDVYKYYVVSDTYQVIRGKISELIIELNNTQFLIIDQLKTISNKWRISQHKNFTLAFTQANQDGKKAQSLAIGFYAIEDSVTEIVGYWNQTAEIMQANIKQQNSLKASRTPEKIKIDEIRDQIFSYRMQQRQQQLMRQQSQFLNSLNSQMAFQSRKNSQLQQQITDNQQRSLQNYQKIQQQSNQMMLQSMQRTSDRMSS